LDFNKRILILEMHGTNIKKLAIECFEGPGFTQSGTPDNTQTDGNDIRPHTAQIYNEHT